MMSDAPIAVAVVEDIEKQRSRAVGLILGHFDEAVAVSEFASTEALLAAEAARFAVVVLDQQLQTGMLQGRDAVRAVAEHTAVLVYSGVESAEALLRAHDAGARGYVSKESSDELLPAGIEAVLAGEPYTDRELQERLNAITHKTLSLRTQEVLRLEALGNKFARIGFLLDPPISEHGVRRHHERILEIYPECRTQADRIRLAIRLGIISPWDR